MAQTTISTNNLLAVKAWSKKLYAEAFAATWFNRFIGDGDDALCQRYNELKKTAGDRITVGLRAQLHGEGVLGDGTLEGNEEAVNLYSDAIVIDQLRHAADTRGRMTQQRTMYNLRDTCFAGLRDWWAVRFDTAFC